MTKQTICLTMMVKNEESAIRRCLNAALPIADCYRIIDTGSTDGTKKIIRQVLRGIPGTIKNGLFENFGATRTQLIEWARGSADYLLVLDADHELQIHDKLPNLTADAYMISLGEDTEWRLPLLISGDSAWRYIGETHEYLEGEKNNTRALLDCISVKDHRDGSNRTNKFSRDADLLNKAILQNPLDPRARFYLAQTYRDLGEIEMAIHHYRIRTTLGGWDEETWYARYQLGCLLCVHKSFLEGSQELIAAWESRPGRAEPLRALANSANNVADKIAFPVEDILFVQRSAYKE